MSSVKGFEVRAGKLIEKFEHLQSNEKITIGAMDDEIREFFFDCLNAILKNYEDDDFYFGVVEVLSDFVYEMSDERTAYRVWCELDFGPVNTLDFGLKEEKEDLVKVRDFYSK